MDSLRCDNRPLKNCTKRSKILFTAEEDQIITKYVNLIGIQKWPLIAKYVPGRTAKQCRDRYMNYLKPGLSNIEWTNSEDELLLQLYSNFGSKWSTINKYIPNRNSISLKNRIKFLQKQYQTNNKSFQKEKGNFSNETQYKQEFGIQSMTLDSSHEAKLTKPTNQKENDSTQNSSSENQIEFYDFIEFDDTVSSFSLFNLENDEYFSLQNSS